MRKSKEHKDQEHYVLAERALHLFCDLCVSREGQCKHKYEIEVNPYTKPCWTARQVHKAFKKIFDKYDK